MATSDAPKKKVILAIERKVAAMDLLSYITRDGIGDLARNSHFMLTLVKSTTTDIRLCLLGLENAGGRVRANVLYAFPAPILTEFELKGPHHVLSTLLDFEDVPLGKTFVVLDDDKYSELLATSICLQRQVVYTYDTPSPTLLPPPAPVIDTTLPVTSPHKQ